MFQIDASNNYLAGNFPTTHQHIYLFLTKLRYVKPALTGNELRKLGIAFGPRMKEILQRLHEAKLDGEVKSKKEEGFGKGVGRLEKVS